MCCSGTYNGLVVALQCIFKFTKCEILVPLIFEFEFVCICIIGFGFHVFLALIAHQLLGR